MEELRAQVAQVAQAIAERDAAVAQRDALAGAVRTVGSLIADNGCDCDCGCAFSDGEHTSECDPCLACLACRVSNVVSPVRGTALDAAPSGFVRADVVRAYVAAVDEPTWDERSLAALDVARTALEAALAAAGGV